MGKSHLEKDSWGTERRKSPQRGEFLGMWEGLKKNSWSLLSEKQCGQVEAGG